MELREYQIDAINRIEGEWNYHRSILFQMPTGTGKTNVFCEIVNRHWRKNQGSTILILTHKRELVNQTCKRLKEFSIHFPGKIMSMEASDPNSRIQIATVQTLIRRKTKLEFLKKRKISLIIIDEAHHIPAETYIDLLNYYSSSDTLILGVTATPQRTDGRGFSEVFNTLIQSRSIKEFIELGYLADVVHYKTSSYYEIKTRLKDIPIDKTTNDFDEEMLGQLMIGDEYMSDAVESYFKYRGDHKRAIVFAVNIKHSESLVDRFRSRGVKAAHLDSKTGKEARENILRDFSNGIISVLCNVGIVTEGFDCPDAEIVQLVRPTKSITLYLQQVGRVLRPKQNGRHALILDSACCYDEFGSVKLERNWTLEPEDNAPLYRISETNSIEGPETTKEPGEMDIEMIQVDKPESSFNNCKIDGFWFEKITPEIREYFIKRFSHAGLNPSELIRNIWKLKEISLSRMPIKSIRDLKDLVNIQNLNISNTNCESFYPIVNLINLKVLNISYCKATILRLPDNSDKLSHLNVSGTPIKDINGIEKYSLLTEILANNTSYNSYKPIADLSKIIRFAGNNSSFNSLSDLWNSRDSLRVLELHNSDLDTLRLIHHFKRIMDLDISYTKISSLGNIYLCRSLKRLVIKGIIIRDKSLKELREKRPDVDIVEY
ncbi:MAG: DEAD/DEAH box helicase family protein [Cyclobacteriaceae bacterium]|nr:DEAD/DEAH box helicase family protein [Cyclobacteriaceae bacterium]